MASYRLFELNPITNEWVDKGFHEGNGQEDTLRKSKDVKEGNTYVLMPATSYHPVTLAKIETVRYAWQYGMPGTEAEELQAEIDAGDDGSAS